MKLLILRSVVFSALISFLMGCGVQESYMVTVTEPSATPSNSHYDEKKENCKNIKKATLVVDPIKAWNISEYRLGRDDLLDVAFVDLDVGWIVAIKGDTLVPSGGSLFKTLNGGRSWKRLFLKLPQNSFISGVRFIDRSRGWLIIQTIDGEATKMQIMETSNGGETWTSGFSLTKAIAARMLLNDKGEGWIIGIKGEATYAHDRQNLVLHTRDFGKTWLDVTPQSASDDTHSASKSVLFEDVFTDVVLDDDSQLESISRDGKISFTTDHGTTWKFATKVDICEEYSQGFSKLIPINRESFIAISGASGPEGVWSTFTSTNSKNSTKKTSSLEDLFISDMMLGQSGDFIASGLRANWEKSVTEGISSAVILTTRDFTTWQLLYEKSSDCKRGCGFNKMSKRGHGYAFVGSDGIVVLIDRKIDR